MTWVKLDDTFDENLKVRGLSDAAFRLYVVLLCYSARKETDGRFTAAIARSFGSPRSIKELVSAGLWLLSELGIEVKDYLSYNPSHAQLEIDRARGRGRVDLHREKKRNTGCNGVTPAGSNRGSNPGSSAEPTALPPVLPPGSGPLSRSEILNPDDPDLSGSYEPKDLTGSARVDLFAASLTGPEDELPEGWQPDERRAALAAELGLDNAEELGMYSAHRRRQGFRCGSFDDDYELWLRRSAKMSRERREARGGAVKAAEWPTEPDARLREAIGAGRHGKSLQAKLAAGHLDAALARRLVREREAELAEREPGTPPDVAALVAGIGRPIP